MTTPRWKRLLARVQDALTAAAFAEEGEAEMATRLATDAQPGKPAKAR